MRYLHFLTEGICMLKRRHFRIMVCVCLVCLMTICAGCTRVQFTTGLKRSTFAVINGRKISMDEAMLLLGELRCSYEKTFDSEVWSENIEGMTAEQYVKNNVRDTLEQIAVLEDFADDFSIRLTDEDCDMIAKAADEYMTGYDGNGTIDKSDVEDFYTSLRMAQKAFYTITDTVDTEVSEDEARVINVQYIYVATVEYDDDGVRTELSQADVSRAYKRVQSLLSQMDDGTDFAALARDNSDDSQYTLEFGRGEYLEEFENAAFKLEVGEISGIVETDIGYYIIKCVNDNVESDYDKRSAEIILSRRMKVFSDQYAARLEKSSTEFNKRFWENTPMDEVIPGTGKLYEIYNKYFVSTQQK